MGKPDDAATTDTLGTTLTTPLRVTPGHLAMPLKSGSYERYLPKGLLGVGGMGEVDLCADDAIGRDVARKRLTGAWSKSEEATPRFLREARIQGQLEHPAVVPVYDLALDEQGAVYFTMKRIRGVTLHQVLAGLQEQPGDWKERFSQRRLLSAFSTVCLAVDFAHHRGVIHRDIKPGNIMLGEFGEVHLLDWGIARIVGDIETPLPIVSAPAVAATEVGAIMGTPGFMAPEQALGEHETLSPATDVYALGATLFELLTLTPLHSGSSVQKLEATLKGVSVRERMAEVAPELVELVERSLTVDRAQRLASARLMSEALERFLDGDRDLKRRRELAAGHLEVAQRYARSKASGRVVAVREVFKALSLDPQNPQAPQTLARLLAEAPDDLPPNAQAERATARSEHSKQAGRLGIVRYLTWGAFAPVVIAMGVRNWPLGLSWVAAMFAAALSSFVLWRTGAPKWSVLTLALSTVALCLTAGLVGPYIVVPALAATNSMFFAAYGDDRIRRLGVTAGLAAVLLPVAAEWLGWLNPAYSFVEDAVVVLPRLTHFPPALTHAAFLATSLALVVTPVLMAAALRRRVDAAEGRLFAHAWLLRQLVPTDVRESSSPSRVR